MKSRGPRARAAEECRRAPAPAFRQLPVLVGRNAGADELPGRPASSTAVITPGRGASDGAGAGAEPPAGSPSRATGRHPAAAGQAERIRGATNTDYPTAQARSRARDVSSRRSGSGRPNRYHASITVDHRRSRHRVSIRGARRLGVAHGRCRCQGDRVERLVVCADLDRQREPTCRARIMLQSPPEACNII